MLLSIKDPLWIQRIDEAKGTTMSSDIMNETSVVETTAVSSPPRSMLGGYLRPSNVAWIIVVIAWTVLCAYETRSIVLNRIDPGHHVGKEISFTYNGLRGITFASDNPVTMTGRYNHHFLLVNTKDGSIAEGTVASDNIQNVLGHWTYEFGPAVVSQGNWRRVGGDDYENSPDITLSSASKITLTTYPKGAVWWMWTKWTIAGVIYWFIAGMILGIIGETVGEWLVKLLGRYRSPS